MCNECGSTVEGNHATGCSKYIPAASAGYDPMPEFPTDAQIADACMWHRHDFGLLSKDRKDREMFTMRERWRAIWKAINTPGRGAEFL